MSDKKNKNTFPDRDKILEYLRGGLTSLERHQIEKLILENDFFREVVEGLESDDPELIQEDLQDLSDAIKYRSSLTSGTGFNVYKVAATVSLLILASVIIFFVINILSQPGRNEQVSLNQPEGSDSVKTDFESIPKAREDLGPITPEPEEKTAKFEKLTEPDQKIKLETQTQGIEIPVDSDKIIDQNQFETTEDYQEDVPSGVMSELPDDKTVITTEIVEELAIDQSEVTTLQKINDQITGAEITENKKLQGKEHAGRAVPALASRIEAVDDAPVPVIGYDRYYTYLQDSLRYPQPALDQQIEGIVGIKFIIGKDSIPRNIVITQSIGSGCDEEAIRLIRMGSKWKPRTIEGNKVEAEVKLIIKFILPKER